MIVEMASEEGGVSAEVIRKAFSATEEEFLRVVKGSLGVSPQIGCVGSCCLVGAISNSVLYVANLGDSRAVLGRRGRSNSASVVAQRLSVDHNVGVEEIRKEVEALHPDDSHSVVHIHGVWRIKGIIQVIYPIYQLLVTFSFFTLSSCFFFLTLPFTDSYLLNFNFMLN